MKIRFIWSLLMTLFISLTTEAQVITLDSCRSMALRNNKHLSIGKLEKEIALNLRKSARTKYLPRITAIGGYEWTSKEVSILNESQKSALGSVGTSAATYVGGELASTLGSLQDAGILSEKLAGKIQQLFGGKLEKMAKIGDNLGEGLKNDFRTDTRSIWAGTVMLTQPIYMGGAITALNKMAEIKESMANTSLNLSTNEALYAVDETYWLIVSLKNKQRLAESFNTLVSKLSDDVDKMIKEGVATRADGLKVSVRKNESDMMLSQVNDGLALAKMLLCQQCGLPMDSDIQLADEQNDNLALVETMDVSSINPSIAAGNRDEIQLLQNAVDMTEQVTKLTRSVNLPHIALSAGYLVSNPNVYDGFSRKFAGVWNAGVIVHVPIWNWMDGAYKVRASKAATTMAQYELEEAKEKIELQINQNKFKVLEAAKRLAIAENNIQSAEENLRCANLGFKEGVMGSTEVIAAQTAWLEAQSQKIDAKINVRMSQLALKKAIGEM